MQLRSRLRWRDQLSEALGLAADGVHSLLEFRYVNRVERPHGLPPGRRQRAVRRAGRREYQDVDYEPYELVVELDGGLPTRNGFAGMTSAGTTRMPPRGS